MSKTNLYHFFGLYGLKLTSPSGDWHDRHLFDDATLVPASFLANIADQSERYRAEWMVGLRPYREQLDVSSVQFADQLAQPKPDSFVAIKRSGSANKEDVASSARERAREVAAMLSIARGYYSLNIDGYMDATSLDRGPIGGIIAMPRIDIHSGTTPTIVDADHRTYTSRWLRNPDVLSVAEIQDSLEKATPLRTHSGASWVLATDDAFVATMIKRKRSPIEQRVARSALHLYDAYHAPTPEQRLAQAVTSLEMLFPGSTDFKSLERRLLSLVPIDAPSHGTIHKLLLHRHEYVHDGKKVPDEAGNAVLGISSIVLFYYSEMARRHADLRALVDRLDFVTSIRDSGSISEDERRALMLAFGSNAPATLARWTLVKSRK